MEKTGLVRKVSIVKELGSRERIPYEITNQGKKILTDWLEDSKVSNELKYETLLKLFFGEVTDKSVSIKTIENFESQIEQELELLRIYQENLEKVLTQEKHIYYYLTVSFGVETYEAYLRWCQMAKKMLE